MTIRKYLGCDGPGCISSVEVPLQAPLRDLLPEHWRAILLEGSKPELASIDAHFCSVACLYKWAAKRLSDEAIQEGATSANDQDEPDEPDTAGAPAPHGPKDPAPTLETGALHPAVKRLHEQLRQAMAGVFNPPKTFTYTWPHTPPIILQAGAGFQSGAWWDAGPYMRGEAGATFNQAVQGVASIGKAGVRYGVARDTAGVLLR